MIRVLTYNVKMFSNAMKLLLEARGGKVYWESSRWNDAKRANAIADSIAFSSVRPDVVLFQEVFSEDARMIFEARLRDRYPHRIPRSDSGPLLNEDSGLFFASRLPIERKEFARYPVVAGSDAMSNKGVLGVALDASCLGKDVSLLFFGTHAQSDADDGTSYERVRAQQMRTLAGFAQRFAKGNAKKRPTAALVAGDLNITAEAAGRPTDAYRAMMTTLLARDLFREARRNDAGFTWDPAHNVEMIRDDEVPRRIDFLLEPKSLGSFRLRCTEARVRTFGEPPLSDHFGLEVRVRG